MNEMMKAKQAVISAAFGICSLSEADLFAALEKLYWQGFKAGADRKMVVPPGPRLDAVHDEGMKWLDSL